MTAVFASPVDYERHGRYDSAARLARAREKAGGDAAGIDSLVAFRGRIDGDVRAGRYHLYLNKGCPFCHRLQILLALLKLERAVTVSYVDDRRDGRGWAFRETNGPDPVNGFTLLAEAYRATDPDFEGHVAVPALWDRDAGHIVSTESGDIMIDLATRFGADIDLYPEPLRGEIDALDTELHHNVNFGVYLVGLAQTQADYDAAIERLFGTLDQLDERLSTNRYLFGDRLTLSDIRLWVSLVRFDVAYYPIFRANLRQIAEYPHLWRYARELFRHPAFGPTADFARHKADYVRNFPQLTPSGILPAGPVADWSAP